jgi:two-component system phosphate regulon response regulator PhoB
MPKILVCVADAQLFLLLRHVLANEGFEALLVTQPSDVLRLRACEPVAAALIDWSEGPVDSVGLLTAVKSVVPSCAVILMSRVTRRRDVVPTACDLLLERPFNPDILLQFLRRLRYPHLAANHAGWPGPVLRFADLEMNLATVTVHRAGNEVALTALQFRLLRRLLQAPAVVCQRDDLIESCWPEHVEVEPRTVDIHIGHIRRALEGFGPDLIRTVRGRGYALQMPSSMKVLKPSNS